MEVGIVYEDLLAQVQLRLSIDAPEDVPVPKECSLCEFESNIEDYALQLAADYCTDPEFQKAYDPSQGVCFPHLRMLIERSEPNAQEYLFTTHEQKLPALLLNLDGFIRKQDYRFHGEPYTDAEAQSWRHAVHFFVGDMG